MWSCPGYHGHTRHTFLRHKPHTRTTSHCNLQGADHLKLDGQIIDVEKKDGGYEDNPGLSGPGGAHMRFAARLVVRAHQGEVKGEGDKLRVMGATEALVLLTAATDYNLSKLNFDRSIDPGKKSRRF